MANLNPVAKDTLKAVGLNVSHLFTISDWINICSIRLRSNNSSRGQFEAIRDSDSCYVTLNDEIVDTTTIWYGPGTIVQSECSWSSSSFFAGTNSTFYQTTESQYNYSQNFLKLVLKGNMYSIASSAIDNLKEQHLLLIKTSNNTAKMNASCRTLTAKSEFSVDLTFAVKLKYLH